VTPWACDSYSLTTPWLAVLIAGLFSRRDPHVALTHGLRGAANVVVVVDEEDTGSLRRIGVSSFTAPNLLRASGDRGRSRRSRPRTMSSQNKKSPKHKRPTMMSPTARAGFWRPLTRPTSSVTRPSGNQTDCKSQRDSAHDREANSPASASSIRGARRLRWGWPFRHARSGASEEKG